MGVLNRDYRTVDGGVEIVADDASEIQPAIDEISGGVVDGDLSAGVVRLKPKAYYPETTILLKRGVTLRGSRTVHKHVTGGDVDERGQSTTLYTSGMERGPEAYTWHHFNGQGDREHLDNPDEYDEPFSYEDQTHPHYPVVAGFDRYPVQRDRDRTEYERFHRGHGVGLENVLIRADEPRWWDWAEHGAGDTWTREEHATYFGVFDGFIFEGLNWVHVENVEVDGFRGYGGFYSDTRHIVSRGNIYNGGWTDHHGSALTLSRNALGSSARYVRGIWDVEVRGPTPALSLGGHGVRDVFAAGGWSRARITGLPPRFLGDESAFDEEEAPLAPSSGAKNTTIIEPDSHTVMNGYQIVGNGEQGSIGYAARDSNTRLLNTRIENVDVAIDGTTQQDIFGQNLHLLPEETGIYCKNFQGNWSNVLIEGATNGLKFWARASPDVGFHNLVFRNVTNGLEGSMNQAIDLDHPDFRGCETPITKSGFHHRVVISSPTGYSNAASGQSTFPGDGATAAYSFVPDIDEDPAAIVATPTNVTAQEHWPVRWEAERIGDDEFEVTFTFTDPLPDDSEATLTWAVMGWTHPRLNVQR